MHVPKPKKKASEILRETTVEQCIGNYKDGERYCSIGLMANYFGWKGFDKYNMALGMAPYAEKMQQELGLDGQTRLKMMEMNNVFKMSFSEIADYLERIGL